MMYVYGYMCVRCVLSNVKSSAVNLSYQSTNLVTTLTNLLLSPMNPRSLPQASRKPPAGRALQPPSRPLPPRNPPTSLPHPPCNASLRGWECGSGSRPPRVLRACRRFYLWRRRRLARAGLRFARWGRAAARPLVSSHGLADREPLPTLPRKPPRRPLGGFSSLPMRDAPCHLCALGTASGA